MTLTCISLDTMQPVPISEANILCLGNFDGVHLAHRALLCRAKEIKREQFPDAACGVFCFKDLPAEHLLKSPPKHLCTLDQKLSAFRDEGMDFAILADFEELRSLSPEDFVNNVLLSSCHAKALVCGFNYRFGKGGAGTHETLSNLLPKAVTVVDKVTDAGETVSSSRIRALLAEGLVEDAARLLTKPYTICAVVEHGKALGRRLGAPTINQRFPEGLQPLRHGVYVTECRFDGSCYRGVTNVGVRPTVDNATEANCETYLIGFDGSLYEKEVEISFLRFLRPEQRFENQDALRMQIAEDIKKAREI